MQNPLDTAALSTFLFDLAKTAHAPGLAVGAAQAGELLYFGGFGHADVARGFPVTVDTVFGLASVTKSYTCVALMQLQEQGRLRVDDPVVRHLPEFRTPDPRATERITLHHLMTHSSGLPDLPFLADARAAAAGKVSPAEHPYQGPLDTHADLLTALATYPYCLLDAPGQLMNYSNEGYALLGAIIERVSGLPYHEYLDQHILQPAGMTRSGSDLARLSSGGDVATRYERPAPDAPPAPLAPESWTPLPLYAAGGTALCSTVRDLLRYAQIFTAGGTVDGVRILGAQSVRAMCSPFVPMPPFLSSGYGLRVQPEYHGVCLVEHTGGTRGVGAALLMIPERELAVVALFNMQTPLALDAALGAMNAALGLPPDAPRHALGPYEVPPAELTAYAGVYRSEEGEPVRVEVTGGVLALQLGTRHIPARPVAPHTFAARTQGGERTFAFRVGSGGRVDGIYLGGRLIRRAAE